MGFGLFDWIIVIVGLGLSLWNSFAAGFAYGMYRRTGDRFDLFTAIVGAAIGFVGFTYYIAAIISAIAPALGWMSAKTAEVLMAYNNLVFGGLIVGIGYLVLAQSIYATIKSDRKSFWDIATVLWNLFAVISNTISYATEFSGLLDTIKDAGKDEDEDASMILLVAALIAVLLTFAAFKAGQKVASQI